MSLWRVLVRAATRRGQAPATTETKPNKKVDRYSRRKSKNGNEKSGFARRLSAKPRFFLLHVALNCAFSICRV